MRTSHRIGIGFLVGLCFAGGYAARTVSARHELEAAGLSQPGPISAPGTSVASARLEGGANIDLRPLETMLMVLKNLREHYVEQITPTNEGQMTHDSLRGMLASLNDPNTRFLDPAQRKLVTEEAQGNYHGIGAVLGVKPVKSGKLTEEHLVVIAPLDGSPAAKAGMKTGDDITEVDGKPVLPFNPYLKAETIIKDEWNTRKVDQNEVRKQLKAEQKRIDSGIGILDAENLLVTDPKADDKDAKKEVQLTIVRKGVAKPMKIKVAREPFTVEPLTSSVLDDGVGYLRINSFTRGIGDKLHTALADLRSKDVKSLVLDLRGVAGGEVDSVQAVAKPFFTGNRTLGVELRSRGRRSVVTVPSAEAGSEWDKPVVVLVNGGTARMAELLAAAIRDNRGARLVGQKTYGDLSETTLIDQRDGSAIELTTGAFLTPKGGNYNGKGIPVDVEVASAGSGDPQLKEAAKLAAAGGKG